MARVFVNSDIPDDLVQSFLQAIRAWESCHPTVAFTIAIDSATMDVRTAEAMFDQIDPPFPHRVTVPRVP